MEQAESEGWGDCVGSSGRVYGRKTDRDGVERVQEARREGTVDQYVHGIWNGEYNALTMAVELEC